MQIIFILASRFQLWEHLLVRLRKSDDWLLLTLAQVEDQGDVMATYVL